MRALLVVNPTATTTSPRVRDILARALGSELKLDVAETAHRDHAVELGRQAAADGTDLVVVLGGDGTVNEVINGLLAAGPSPDAPALAVVPGGSTNVFSRALEISRDPVEATSELLEAVRAGRSRRIGLGRADDRWFTFAAGLGLDADAVRVVEQARANGRNASPTRYAWSAVRQFLVSDRRHPALTLERPGEEPLEGLHLGIVTNTTPWTYFGRRQVRMTDTARFETGLDLVTLTRLRLLGTSLAAARMLTERGIRGRRVLRFHDLQDFTLTADRPLHFQVDGDYLGQRERVSFQAVPHALRVVCGGSPESVT